MNCGKCHKDNLKNTKFCFFCEAELPRELRIPINRKIVTRQANRWVRGRKYVPT
ncbi:MAG: hypothetical protein QF682_05245 [Candidatus Thermoplasmatota archaeon]|nr:hypothetical protein [Candidatus Thermoplasmatota archaeon]